MKALSTITNKTQRAAGLASAYINMALLSMMMPVYAGNDAEKGGVTTGGVTIEKVKIGAEGDNPENIIDAVLGIILFATRYIGAALIIWGLVMFGLSIKNDEPESKQKALMTTFAGVVVFSLKWILQTAGITAAAG